MPPFTVESRTASAMRLPPDWSCTSQSNVPKAACVTSMCGSRKSTGIDSSNNGFIPSCMVYFATCSETIFPLNQFRCRLPSFMLGHNEILSHFAVAL